MKPTVPEYAGRWIGEVVTGLSAGSPAPWLPSPALEARSVVVLVLDGLGWQMLEGHRADMPTLARMQGAPITSVAPTTTATALTSMTTGVTPARHGVVGYRFRVGGEVMNALRWRLDASGQPGPSPAEVQPVVPFGGVDVPVVSKAEFATTGFTTAHLRGTTLHGWRTPANLVTHCRRLVTAGERLVYAYYDGVDRIAHNYGLGGDFLQDELRATDRLVADVLESLPPEAALVVTADHGQVDVGPEGQRSLEGLAPYVAAYSGKGRFRSLHARSGAARDLRQAACDLFEEVAWVRTREQVAEEGWLGPGMSPSVAGRLGDVVLAAREPVAFVDPGYPQEATLISMHGSLTAEEMLVPLLAAAG